MLRVSHLHSRWAVVAGALRKRAITATFYQGMVAQLCTDAAPAQQAMLQHEPKDLHNRAKVLLNRYSRGRNRDPQKLMHVLNDMELMGVHMDSMDFRRTIMYLSQEDMVPEMDELFKHMKHRAVLPDMPTCRAMIEAYARHGHSAKVLEMLRYLNSLQLDFSSMEHLFTVAKMLFGHWTIGQYDESFELLAELRGAGAPVADVLHTALVELHGRNFRAHSERPAVLSALCSNLLHASDTQDAELVVLVDYCSDQFEMGTLQRLLMDDRVMPLLSEEQLEAGAARMAKSLTLPGAPQQQERTAVYERIGEFMLLLHESGHECCGETCEDMLWAAASLEEWRHALHWAMLLAEQHHAVLQWQQLPDVFAHIIIENIQAVEALGPGQLPSTNAGAWGKLPPRETAEALIKEVCPPARQAIVLQQLWSRTGGHPSGANTATSATATHAGGLPVDALFDDDDSDSGSDQDIEDMVFSDDSDDERL